MPTSSFEDLFPVDREWEARKQRLMALTVDERVAAMRAGQLSYRELCHWSAARPDEVPRLVTGEGGGGEFEWIAALMPEIAESSEVAPAARAHQRRSDARVARRAPRRRPQESRQ